VFDPDGHLALKLADVLPRLLSGRFSSFAVATTTNTDDRVIDLLRSSGASIIASKSDVDAVGRRRRGAVARAVQSDSIRHVFYADLDHVLRWIENDDKEFDDVLDRIQRADFTVVGRGPRSIAALPRRLALTEGIVNEVFALTSGRRWDVMMAARGLSRRAAEAIVRDCHVDTYGNDCEWPLFCAARGFSLDYVEAEGLTYLTNADYAHGTPDRLDNDPAAWALRVKLASQHVVAMTPYMRNGT
jgi:hypothetical protein